jgi:hypothetical protein
MPNFLAGIESSRLLFDLQQTNEIAESLAGCLEPEEIAQRVTAGLNVLAKLKVRTRYQAIHQAMVQGWIS